MGPNSSPREAFKSFLDRAESDGWIAGYQWQNSESFVLLREKMGGVHSDEEYSRTVKRSTDGQWWGLVIEAHYGTAVAVDMDMLVPRPVLDEGHWLSTRLALSRRLGPKQLLEEWSARECAYKALRLDEENLQLPQFRRSPNAITVFTMGGERSAQIRNAWNGRWLMTLAWRTRDNN